MFLLRWSVPLLLLLPALWWGWHQLHAPPPATKLASGAYLEWTDCWFERPLLRPVHCGRFHTAPESTGGPASFSLPVVYISQWAWERSGPPVQYIAGGPGGAAWLAADDVDFWFRWIQETDWPGDLVLYDQRGVVWKRPQ